MLAGRAQLYFSPFKRETERGMGVSPILRPFIITRSPIKTFGDDG
jgi:hypothetical protein